jgi:hypothetical protein
MAYHPYVPPDARDAFRPVYRTRLNGTVVELMGTPDGGFIVRRRLDPRIVQAVKDANRDQAGIWRKGKLIGNTQTHMMPIASLPAELHFSLKEKWGDPKKDPDAAKRWKKGLWNNSEARAFRSSEHSV